MYTIRPFCAGVCGFEGPHPDTAIASIAASTTAKFRGCDSAEFFDPQVFFDRRV
jgi:hypothetical protein